MNFETLTVAEPTADRTSNIARRNGTVVVKDSNTGAIQLPVALQHNDPSPRRNGTL